MKKIIFLSFMILNILYPILINAEVGITSDLTAVSGIIDTGNEPGFYSYVHGSIYFKSIGSRNVKAALQLLPNAFWKEEETAYPGNDPGYALFCFQDLSIKTGNSFTYYVRSLISPIDLSALFFGGFDWNIYQGFYLSIQSFVQAGDSNDVWGWNRFGDIAFLTGFKLKI